MKYRRFGRMDEEASALGFGTMRLPVKGGEKDVDESAAIEMIRYAIDSGVNYVDTAWPYHGGNSEVVTGKALRDGYRQRVRLATKLPVWDVQSIEDCDRIFEQQLGRLQDDYIDYYLLHCLSRDRWAKMQRLGVLEWLEGLRADGRIGRTGFSFHDSFEAFKEIVDAYDWPVCQIQYNYVCEDVQAGTEGLEYAAAKGLAVIIMEPLFGGTLASPPEQVGAIWRQAGADPVDTALQWLWSKPQVSLVLSGMSTLDQVRRNVASACRSGVGSLGKDRLDLIARVQAEYRELSPIPCTKCGYCMPCPNGVDIPRNIELYNNSTVLKGSSLTLCRNLYQLLPEGERAGSCVQCRECEDKCPQKIEISRHMSAVHEAMG
jgi:predicted aldo/keto reductase-like oxidoreductase